MHIVIHGTKGGWDKLYTSENAPLSVAKDVRPYSVNENAVGKEAFSVAFSNDGTVFSKYKIIRDKIRGSATGNIAVSLLISYKERMSGVYIFSLLNFVLDSYCSKYAPDNNLYDEPEDWSFVEACLAQYRNNLKSGLPGDEDLFLPGTNEAAFVYFSSDQELQIFFEFPFQEEYKAFKQVYFISKELKSKLENPLNALRHNPASDLTGKIDLENPKYTLLFKENANDGIKIEVKVNGGKRSNEDKIRLKDILKISYSKPYHVTFHVEGNSIADNVKQYLIINPENRTITIIEKSLFKEEKSIKLRITDRKGNPIDNADITYQKGSGSIEKAINSEIKFSGEEFKEKWKIKVKQGNRYAECILIPENENGEKDIPIEERREIEIRAIDDISGDLIRDFDIRIETKEKPINNKIIFEGEEIVKEWNIFLVSKSYQDYSFTYCPSRIENQYYDIKLTKRSQQIIKKYSIDPGVNGQKASGCPNDSSYPVNNDISKNWIIPIRGYEFIGFNLDTNSWPNCDGILIAQYRKGKTIFSNKIFRGLVVFAVVIIIVCILALGYYSKFVSNKPTKENGNEVQIEKYAPDPQIDTIPKNVTSKIKEPEEKEKTVTLKSEPSQDIAQKKKNPKQTSNQTQTKGGKDSVINTYLQGYELKKDTLSGYKKDIDSNSELYQSINICLEFWKLVEESINKEDFTALKNKVLNDKNLKDSDLKLFLEKICQNPKTFPFGKISGKSKMETLFELQKAYDNQIKNK